jgi:6-phosphogluconolactonase
LHPTSGFRARDEAGLPRARIAVGRVQAARRRGRDLFRARALDTRRARSRKGLQFHRRSDMNRKNFLRVLGVAALAMATGPLLAVDALAKGKKDDVAGSVYTMTNDAAGNAIVVFDRDGKGALTLAGAVPTGGLGSGGGFDPLASQGSLVLTDNNKWLLAVNAGSNELSVFRVKKDGLELVDVIPSGGEYPTSLAVFQDLVYVLNTGGTPNITGFKLNHKGHLAAIGGSTREIPGAVSAQIGFDPRGDVLVVTDRSAGNGRLIVYPVGESGKPAAAPIVTPSSGPGPFAFVFTAPRTLLVAEVGSNAVSSYELRHDGSLKLETPSVPNGQAATCWIVDVKGRYAFTANPGTSSLSSFKAPKGKKALALLEGVAGTGMKPLDLAVAENGKFLYALDPDSPVGGIDIFRVGHDGELTNLGPMPAGLPLYAQGLAAR